MLKYIITGIFSTLFITILFSQSDELILKTRGLGYTSPLKFRTYIPKSDCFDENPRLSELMRCVSKGMISDDGEFIAFMKILPILSNEDSIKINSMFPGSLLSLNTVHIGNIRNNIREIYGKDVLNKWRDYVVYWSSKKAKNIFNADTVVTYNVKLGKEYTYEGKYDHFGALYIQKKDRSFINYYFLFTEKANKRISSYLKLLEKTLKYDDWTNGKPIFPNPPDETFTVYKEGNEWKVRKEK